MPSDEDRYAEHVREIGGYDTPEGRAAWEAQDRGGGGGAPGGDGWEGQLRQDRQEWERQTRQSGEWDRWAPAEREAQYARHAVDVGFGTQRDLEDYLSGRPTEGTPYDALVGRLSNQQEARDGGMYQVRPGDTFYDIAARYRIDPEELKRWNPRSDYNQIRVGEIFTIPGYNEVGNAPSRPRSVAEALPPQPTGHWEYLAIPQPAQFTPAWYSWLGGPKVQQVWKADPIPGGVGRGYTGQPSSAPAPTPPSDPWRQWLNFRDTQTPIPGYDAAQAAVRPVLEAQQRAEEVQRQAEEATDRNWAGNTPEERLAIAEQMRGDAELEGQSMFLEGVTAPLSLYGRAYTEGLLSGVDTGLTEGPPPMPPDLEEGRRRIEGWQEQPELFPGLKGGIEALADPLNPFPVGPLAERAGPILREAGEEAARGFGAAARGLEAMGPYSRQMAFIPPEIRRLMDLGALPDEIIAPIQERYVQALADLDDVQRRIYEATELRAVAKEGLGVIRPPRGSREFNMFKGLTDQDLMELARREGRNPFGIEENVIRGDMPVITEWYDGIDSQVVKDFKSSRQSQRGGRSGEVKRQTEELRALAEEEQNLADEIAGIEEVLRKPVEAPMPEAAPGESQALTGQMIWSASKDKREALIKAIDDRISRLVLNGEINRETYDLYMQNIAYMRSQLGRATKYSESGLDDYLALIKRIDDAIKPPGAANPALAAKAAPTGAVVPQVPPERLPSVAPQSAAAVAHERILQTPEGEPIARLNQLSDQGRGMGTYEVATEPLTPALQRLQDSPVRQKGILQSPSGQVQQYLDDLHKLVAERRPDKLDLVNEAIRSLEDGAFDVATVKSEQALGYLHMDELAERTYYRNLAENVDQLANEVTAPQSAAARDAIAAANLPPVADGYIRLYRGQSSGGRGIPEWVASARQSRDLTHEGRWFTNSLENVQWYLDEAGDYAQLVYVDVPEDIAKASHLPNQPKSVQRFSRMPNEEWFLPQEYAQQSREVVIPKATADSIVVGSAPAPQSAAARDALARAEAPIPDYAQSWDGLPEARRRAILSALGKDTDLAKMSWAEMANEERRSIVDAMDTMQSARQRATERVMGQGGEGGPPPPPKPPLDEIPISDEPGEFIKATEGTPRASSDTVTSSGQSAGVAPTPEVEAFVRDGGAPPGGAPPVGGGPPAIGGAPPGGTSGKGLVWEMKPVAENEKDLFSPSFWRNMGRLAAQIPDVGAVARRILELAKPSAVAFDRVTQAFILRDKDLGFARTAPDVILAQLRARFPKGSNFAVDEAGDITNITIKRSGASAHIDDVLSEKNPLRSYDLTPDQLEEFKWLRQLVEEAADYAKKQGVPIEELSFPVWKGYFPRIPRNIQSFDDVQKAALQKATTRPVGAPQTFQKARTMEEARDGVQKGVEYLNDPWKTAEIHLQQVYTAIANKRFIDHISDYATPGGKALKGVVTELVYPPKLAAEIDARLADRGWAPLRAAAAASDALRGMTAGMDIGQFMIQGQTLMGHPVVWTKSAGRSLLALVDPAKVEAFRAAHADAFENLIRNNLLPSRSMPYLESGELSKVYKIPVFGAAYKRAQTGFGAFFDAAAAYLWEGLAPLAKAQAGPQWEAELTTLMRNMLGMGNTIGMGANQKLAEQTMAFALSYYRASAGLILGISKGGIHATEGLKALGAMAAAWLAWETGASLAQGQRPNLDPREGDFNSVNFGGWNIGPGSIWNSLYKSIGRMVAYGVLEPAGIIEPLKDTKGKPIKHDPLETVLGIARDWGRSHSGPLISAGWDIASRKTYLGDPLSTAEDWVRYGASRVVPFAFQDFVAPRDVPLTDTLRMLPFQMMGLRVWPDSHSTKRNALRTQYAQAGYGKEWYDLTYKEQAKLLENNPDLKTETEAANAYFRQRNDPEDNARFDRVQAWYTGSEPIYSKYEDLLRAVPLGDDTGKKELYSRRQAELDALTKRIGLRDEDFGQGKPLYGEPSAYEGKLGAPEFNANERQMFSGWAAEHNGMFERAKDKNGVIDPAVFAVQAKYVEDKGDLAPRFRQYLDRNLTPRDMVAKVYGEQFSAWINTDKEKKDYYPAPTWQDVGAVIMSRWGHKFTDDPDKADHPNLYLRDELNEVLADTFIPAYIEYDKINAEDRINGLQRLGEQFYSSSGVLVTKDNLPDFIKASKEIEEYNAWLTNVWNPSKGTRAQRSAIFDQINGIDPARNAILDNPELSLEERQQAYTDAKERKSALFDQAAALKAQIPTRRFAPQDVVKFFYGPQDDALKEELKKLPKAQRNDYFTQHPEVLKGETAGPSTTTSGGGTVSRGSAGGGGSAVSAIFKTMPEVPDAPPLSERPTAEEVQAYKQWQAETEEVRAQSKEWWATNRERLIAAGWREEPYKEEISRILDTKPKVPEGATPDERAEINGQIRAWKVANYPTMMNLGWTPNPIYEEIDSIFEEYGRRKTEDKKAAYAWLETQQPRLAELGYVSKSDPNKAEIGQIWDRYYELRDSGDKRAAAAYLEQMKPQLAKLGYEFKEGDRESPDNRTRGGYLPYDAAKDEPTTKGSKDWRAEFEKVHGRPPNEIDYQDMLWSLQFQKENGRPPIRADWSAHYNAQVRGGTRPSSRTPEFATGNRNTTRPVDPLANWSARERTDTSGTREMLNPLLNWGNGERTDTSGAQEMMRWLLEHTDTSGTREMLRNRSLTNNQWDMLQAYLGPTAATNLIGKRFLEDAISEDTDAMLRRYFREHPYGAADFADWLTMAKNAYARELQRAR